MLALDQEAGRIVQEFPREFEHGRGGWMRSVRPHDQTAFARIRGVAPGDCKGSRTGRAKRGLIQSTTPGRQQGIGAAGEVPNGIDRPAGVALQIPMQEPAGGRGGWRDECRAGVGGRMLSGKAVQAGVELPGASGSRTAPTEAQFQFRHRRWIATAGSIAGWRLAQGEQQTRQYRAQSIGSQLDRSGSRCRDEPASEQGVVHARQQQRDHPVSVGPSPFRFLGQFDLPPQPGWIARVETEHHDYLPGLFDGPAHFGREPIATPQVMAVAPDTQAEGFQRQAQILGESGIGLGVADEDGGGGHRIRFRARSGGRS